MTAPLIAFLRARLDEAETMANTARGSIPVRRPSDGNARPRRVDQQMLDMYVVTFKPERMLADIEAKRRIIDEHAITQTYATGQDLRRVQIDVCKTCSNKHGVPCATLRALALPYTGHPGYQPEWRL